MLVLVPAAIVLHELSDGVAGQVIFDLCVLCPDLAHEDVPALVGRLAEA